MKRGENWGAFVFPKWTNLLRPVLAATLVLVPAYLVVLLAYGASPRTTNVGYQPVQPVPYSHALHAGQLGIDCRYCHNTVEVAAHAAVPPTADVHELPRADPDRRARSCCRCGRATRPALPIPWVRVHDLPDYVYFNHRRTCGAASAAWSATGGWTRWTS